MAAQNYYLESKYLFGLVSDFPHCRTLLEVFTFDLLCDFALEPTPGIEPETY